MSEKRFTVISEKIGRFHNIFVQTDKIEYLLTGDFDNDSEMIKEIVDLLNEQQATISALTKENKELGKNFEDLVEWVSGIAKRNVVLDEQIGQLQRENEKLRENLHNCRLNKNIISEKLKLWQDVHKEYNIYSIKDFEELMKNDK